MNSVPMLMSLPAELEVWLILGYVLVVLSGARLCEVLARVHFQRAHQYAERGFKYDEVTDQYHCPKGERLNRDRIQFGETVSRMAVYRAPASTCNRCPLKASCTPNDDGRRLYRPLAAWIETDVGRFHRRVSLVMIGAGMVFALGGLGHWMGRPGTGLMLLALGVSLFTIVRSLSGAWPACGMDIDEAQ
ncbi:MAG: hypothetical protein ABJA67_03700 [Chthonomonadales bacterium]